MATSLAASQSGSAAMAATDSIHVIRWAIQPGASSSAAADSCRAAVASWSMSSGALTRPRRASRRLKRARSAEVGR
ncbi:hypothetical protein WQ53_09960 [Pseudoxanthomonas suwonensis]|uniref:Uncharacterized protein n=1 Tax=Pseudoxanthomonas suwonensis TaxID=314722 RepID=A0A0E3Z2M5_9GAMM|nr:hypothetical protein WQ53_09960 [Pseudoxanthomonas suwonensis]